MNGVGIPIIVMGGLAAAVSLYFWREGRDLRAGGVEARATIVRKFRKPGLDNCYVTVQFTDAQGVARTALIRTPSRQWHWLREGAEETILYLRSNPQRARVISSAGNAALSVIEIFVMSVGGFMMIGGIALLALGTGGGGSNGAAQGSMPPPPPTKFDKSGTARLSMIVSPRHDRVAVYDEDAGDLRIRDLAGGLLAAADRKHWKPVSWSPDGSRIAVLDGQTIRVLDSALKPLVGESNSWDRPAPALAECPGPPIWDPGAQRAAAVCGNQVMIADSSSIRMLGGHTDRVVAIAWSPSGRRLASAGEDNYVRVWDPATQRCLAISEDYPYPRAIFFQNEESIVVIDLALRRYVFRL